jgi:hypothetical protein
VERSKKCQKSARKWGDGPNTGHVLWLIISLRSSVWKINISYTCLISAYFLLLQRVHIYEIQVEILKTNLGTIPLCMSLLMLHICTLHLHSSLLNGP